jgi:hypothetical protein
MDSAFEIVPSAVPSQNAETNPPFADFTAFRSEYSQARDTLSSQLPGGKTLPEEVPGDWDRSGRFEDGAGEMTAALIFQCQWIEWYATARDRGDGETVAHSLDVLEGWPDMKEVSPHIDAESAEIWRTSLVGAAREGHPDRLLEAADTCAE